jgi:hypothetical protein
MKSIEELIDDIIELAEEGVLYTPDYFKDKYKMDEQLNQSKDNKAEILRRVEELEKELLKHTKAFSTLWNCYKEIDKERISLSIRAEQAEEQVERLRCCGNCINYGYDMEEDRHYCNKHIYSGKRHAGICTNNWQSDNLTRKERET